MEDLRTDLAKQRERNDQLVRIEDEHIWDGHSDFCPLRMEQRKKTVGEILISSRSVADCCLQVVVMGFYRDKVPRWRFALTLTFVLLI